MSYEQNNETFEMDDGETRYLSSEVAGGFTGVYLAMYATGNGEETSVPADFDWFEYS
ncbi:MAG: glycoside hydrolase family 43 protein, partial [Halanaerobiaceae bacterium]